MQTLNTLKNNTPKTWQGFVGLAIFGLAIWGLIHWVLNPFMEDLAKLLKNTWLVVLLGTPLALIVLYCVTNPVAVWMFFASIGRAITAFFVKIDPLSVMDRYVDLLKRKIAGLRQTIAVLQGKKNKLDRQAADLQKNIQENLRLGAAAMKTADGRNAASTYGDMVATDKQTLQVTVIPLQERLNRNLSFLQQLEDNWKWGIQKLEYQIKAKRNEYEIIKETTKGLKNAEDFINSDNEEARLFGMSLVALEEKVTQQLGYIDEFERRSKDIMSTISIEKQARQDEGLAELERYIQDGKLQMPDFSKMGNIQDVDYIPVDQIEETPKSKFNLLK